MRENALLIYDGDCGLCRKSVRWLTTHRVKAPELELAASQSLGDDALAELGLSREVVDGSLCWVDPEGVSVGPYALLRCLAAMRRPWSLLARALGLPLVFAFVALGYAVVAKNRHRWPGANACGVKPLLVVE